MLTVVTLTNNERPVMLERCKMSVDVALPVNANHIIVECRSLDEYAQLRYESLSLNEYVAFVDDDDTISDNILNHSISALLSTDSGICFTDEIVVNEHNDILPSVQRSLMTYSGIFAHPIISHGLTIYKKGVVDSSVLDIHNKYGAGIDWLMKISAVSNTTAVYIPMVGYYWTNNSSYKSMHTQSNAATNFSRYFRKIQNAAINTWNVKRGQIPIWLPD